MASHHHSWTPPSTPPPDFLCPISLHIMSDPVTLETGITYDRLNIQKWLSSGHLTCPVTGRALLSTDLIPNCTLLHLIHAWSQSGLERQTSYPGDLSSMDAGHVSRLIRRIGTEDRALRELKDVAVGCGETRRVIALAGAVPVLASLLSDCTSQLRDGNRGVLQKAELIIAILSLLRCREDGTGALLIHTGALQCISWVLRWGSEEGKVNAAALLEDISVSQRRLRVVLGSSEGLIQGLIELLMERFSNMAMKLSLNALVALCSAKENRVKAVQAGAIPVLVEVLVQSQVATICEKVLCALEILFLCPEGREAAVKHSQIISRIVDKIFTVSPNASEYAVGALWALCTLSHFLSAYYDAIQAGAIGKLGSIIHTDECTPRTKSQGKQLLKSLQTASILLENECKELSTIQAATTTVGSHRKRRKERSLSS